MRSIPPLALMVHVSASKYALLLYRAGMSAFDLATTLLNSKPRPSDHATRR